MRFSKEIKTRIVATLRQGRVRDRLDRYFELAVVCPIERFGGPGRDRTDDLFHAMEARSQLRHRPTVWGTLRTVRCGRPYVFSLSGSR